MSSALTPADVEPLQPAEEGRHAATDAEVDRATGIGLPPLPEPAERGSLTVADRVVERVAGYVVTEVDGAMAAPRRVLGVTVGSARPDSEASVTARVDGHIATINTSIAVIWPQSVSAVSDRLRQRLRDEVARITDVQVAQIDIDIVGFAAAGPSPRRVQ